MFVKIFQKACKFVLLDFDAILDLRPFNSTLGVVALSDRTVFRSFILTFLQLRRRDQELAQSLYLLASMCWALAVE